MRKIISRLGSHVVEGVEYPNLPSIAEAYGITKNCVYKRYSRGAKGADLVPEKKRTNILRLLKLSLVGFLSLLVWILYFSGKAIEYIKERITNG